MFIQRMRRIPWLALPGRLLGQRLRILMYHSIADVPGDPHALPPHRFAQQMALLSERRYQVISLEESVKRLRRRQPLRRCLVLTFDDAYRDFLTNALPVLEQFGYPATIFVPTGRLGGNATWHSFDKQKRLLDWDELAEVHRRGVSVGSHTVTHPRLTECSDRELEYELCASLECLRSQIGSVFPSLSYPGGFFGTREQLAARTAGYVCAVGVSSHWQNGHETSPLGLRREVLR